MSSFSSSEIFRCKILSILFLIVFGIESFAFGTPDIPQSAVSPPGAPSDPVVNGQRRQMTAEERAKFKPFESKFMKRPQQKSADEKLRDVSDMYEKHFLREMMKAMRSTVHEGGFVQSNQAEKIFREQLDEQYVEKWGQRGGIGLSDMIYKQLVDKFGVAMGIKTPVAKPQGPLPLDAKSEYRAKSFQHPGKKRSMSYRIDVGAAGTEGAEAERAPVKAPWGGVLLAKKDLADHQTMLEIKHDNGLKSQVVFKGGANQISAGQKLQAGDTLGFLSPEAKSVYWTVEPGPETVSE